MQIVHTFLPKKGEIECPLKQVNRKILQDTHLPVSLKDLKAYYLTSPHFRNIYIYLLQNKIPIEKQYAKELQHNSKNYMVLHGLLFKIISTQGMEPYPVLCIPMAKVSMLLDYYHSSLFGGNSGNKVFPNNQSMLLL